MSAPRTTRSNRRRAVRRRRAYILMIVLGLTAVIASLSLAFIEANSTVAPQAANRYRAARARYLAESGVQVGMHYLIHPPPTVADGDYWRGETGIAIDGTTDYANVGVTRDALDPNLFTISTVGVAHDFDGLTVAGKHALTATVIRPDEHKWRIPYALYGGSYASIPQTVQIAGDLHVQDSIYSEGACTGHVTATGTIDWKGGGPPASITPFAAPAVVPPVDPTPYLSYVYKGNEYTAYSWPFPDMYSSEAASLNSLNWTATNPGRIIAPPIGNFLLRDFVGLSGTIVVRGSLIVGGDAISVTAAPNFPAVVVTGNIVFARDGADIDFQGSVLCGGSINDQGHPVGLSVTGACMVHGTTPFTTVGVTDVIRFTWDPARSVFWDLEGVARHEPITVLSWKEN